MQQGIIRPKAEREALREIHEPHPEGHAIAGNIPFYEARNESRERFRMAHGHGPVSVTVPELPWKKGK